MNKFPARTRQDIARQWRSLAERKRQHLTELYHSGRWRRYYTEESFLAQMRETARAAEAWDALARAGSEPAKPLNQ